MNAKIMNCNVYKSLKKDGMYLFVAEQQELDDLPEALMAQFGKAELVMALELTPERQLAQADSKRVIQCLEDQGYYLQLPPSELFGQGATNG